MLPTKTISSRRTFFQKFILTPLFSGVIVVIFALMGAKNNYTEANVWYIVPILFFFYLIWKYMFSIKEVTIDWPNLKVSNFANEIQVPLYKIKKAKKVYWVRPFPIEIEFIGKTEFGKFIYFLPTSDLEGLNGTIIEELNRLSKVGES
ncbi:MAG: hypothetical protein MI802_28775 [Desulfobacterales bacterium]|nr:hypothetical protein [Desulfobacterales bacterium]